MFYKGFFTTELHIELTKNLKSNNLHDLQGQIIPSTIQRVKSITNDTVKPDIENELKHRKMFKM